MKKVSRPTLHIIGSVFLLGLILMVAGLLLFLFFKDSDLEVLEGSAIFFALFFIWIPLLVRHLKKNRITITEKEISGNFFEWFENEKDRAKLKKASGSFDLIKIKNVTDIYVSRLRSGVDYIFLFELNQSNKVYIQASPFLKKQIVDLKKDIMQRIMGNSDDIHS
jgi:hypothetical protein